MSKTSIAEPTVADTQNHEATVEHYLAETARICAELAADRKEIQALQAETRALLARLQVA